MHRLALSQTFIGFDRETGSHALEDLYQHNQKQNRNRHNQVLVSVVAVVNGNFTETAAADDAAHGGVAEYGGDGDGQVVEQGRNTLRDHDLADNLQRCCAHALRRLDDVGVDLAQTALRGQRLH